MGLEFTGFVPAVDPKRLLDIKRLLPKYVWWEKSERFVYYPYLLVSAYNGLSFGYSFRKDVGLEDVFLIGDSGGWQIVSRGVDLDPVKVLRWLEGNCDIGVALDYPMPPQMSKEFNFKELAKKSADAFRKMEKSRENYDIILLKVLHGSNKEQLQYWYDMVKDVQMDGWALSAKGIPAELHWALQFTFLYDKGELDNECKWLHLFAVTGSRTLPVIYYIKSVYGRDTFSFDSSAWANGFKFRRYFSPLFYGITDIQIGRNPDKMKVKIDSTNLSSFNGKTLCMCPICQDYPLGKAWVEDSFGGYLISLHNLYILLGICLHLNSLSANRDVYKNWVDCYVGLTGDTDISLAIKMIDVGVTSGFEEAYSLFKEYYLKSYGGKRADVYLGGTNVGGRRLKQTSLI